MESTNSTKAKLSILGCCLAVFWSGSIAFGYPGVMATYWQETFQVGSGETGAVLTFMLLGLAVCMFFSGKIHVKVGTRVCILFGTLFNILAMLILFQAKSISSVYAWAFFANVGCSFVYGPGLATVQQWLPQRRGLACGLFNTVFGASSAIMSPIWNSMLGSVGYDWINYILLACIVGTNALAMVLAASPERPKPAVTEEAASKQPPQSAGKNDGRSVFTDGFTVSQAVKTKPFWIIWFTWVFMGAAGISMISIAKGYAMSLGLASVVVLTAFSITNGFGRIVAGMLTDIIGGETTGIIAFALASLAYILMPHIDGVVGVSILAACIGFGFGTLFTVTGPIASGIFGLAHFGAIFGLIFTAYGFVGGLLGPALSGAFLDYTNANYTLVFAYLAALAAVGALLMAFLKRTTARQAAARKPH